MEEQKCSQCGATMILVHNRDGSSSYKCEYCGHRIDIRPQTASDHISTFINRAINAVSEAKESLKENLGMNEAVQIDPKKQQEYDERLAAINAKHQKAYEKRMEQRLKYYDKYMEKRNK